MKIGHTRSPAFQRVTFSPTSPLAALGPVNQDVFYFGNLKGETGDVAATDPDRLTVTATDRFNTRRAMNRRFATITSRYDFDRDGRVNVLDYAIAGRGRGQSVTLLTAPPPPLAAAAPVRDDVLTS